MNKKFLWLIGIFFVLSCVPEPPAGVPLLDEAALKDEATKVEMVLERYVIASEKQDIDLIESIWATDDSVIVFGTTGAERLKGWPEVKNAFKAQFSELQQPLLAVHDQVIRVNQTGTTAWFSEVLNYSFVRGNQSYNLEGVRFTGVLEKRDSTWIIVQSHLSVPAAEN